MGSRHFLRNSNVQRGNCGGDIWEVLGRKAPEDPGAQTFEAIVSMVGKERERARKKPEIVQDEHPP